MITERVPVKKNLSLEEGVCDLLCVLTSSHLLED